LSELWLAMSERPQQPDVQQTLVSPIRRRHTLHVSVEKFTL